MSVYAAFAERPPSEVEWEDLLVRYELGPRAVAVALDGGGRGREAAPRVGDVLRALVANELLAADLLAAMRDGRAVDGTTRIATMGAWPEAALARYQALRARNFAAVQRRGIDVWSWRAEAPGGQGPVTAHQLIRASLALDGQTLGEIRQLLRGAPAC